MNLYNYYLSYLMIIIISSSFIACGVDEGSEDRSIDDGNGKNTNEVVFSAIDDNNFYVDYVKYTVKNGHLVVTGYDATGIQSLNGDVVIVPSIRYKENTYQVLEMEAKVFERCIKLSSISIPSTITTISNSAFSGCTNLTTVKLQNTLTVISDYAFDGCSALVNITIPNSVKELGRFAFHNCKSLSSIKIPNSLEIINPYVFGGCSNLINVSIPNSVVVISEFAFSDCCSLKSVFIPSSVTHISNKAFRDCIDLEKIEVDKGNQFYDSRDNCNAIIQKADNLLVVGCKTTIIPKSITKIGSYSFYRLGNTIETVKIPSGVKQIGEYAFYLCDIKRIECMIENPLECTTNLNAFSASLYYSAALIVPEKAKHIYMSCFPWKSFKYINPVGGIAILEDRIISDGLQNFEIVTLSGQGWHKNGNMASANNFDNNNNHTTTESYLISEPLNLLNAERAYVSFDHLITNLTDGGDVKLLISDTYTGNPITTNWMDITGNLAKKTNSNSYSSYDYPILLRLVGKNNIRIAFYYKFPYTSTKTWDVKNFKIRTGSPKVDDTYSGEIVYTQVESLIQLAQRLVGQWDGKLIIRAPDDYGNQQQHEYTCSFLFQQYCLESISGHGLELDYEDNKVVYKDAFRWYIDEITGYIYLSFLSNGRLMKMNRYNISDNMFDGSMYNSKTDEYNEFELSR